MSESVERDEPIFRFKLLTGLLLAFYLVAFVGLMMFGYFNSLATDDRVLVDFDVFHLAGQMFWEGSLNDAYQYSVFSVALTDLSTSRTFMPWTYPPQFGLLAAVLALVPAWLARVVFTSVTLVLYLFALKRIAGWHFSAVFVAVLPVIVVNTLIGQNGLLTGALVGFFALLALRGSKGAGVPLGLMVIKPHLAVGLGLAVLLSRRWGWTMQAAAVVAATSLLAAAVFGPGIWGAFLGGVGESKAFLAEGRYPLERMTSVYAGLRMLEIEPEAALAAHFAVALLALAMISLTVVQGWRMDRILAVSTLGTLLVSPYNYDYDLGILGVALALSMKDLASSARRLYPVVLVLAWIASAYAYAGGFLWHMDVLDTPRIVIGGVRVGLAGLALGALTIMLFSMMWKAERKGRQALGPAGQAVGAVG